MKELKLGMKIDDADYDDNDLFGSFARKYPDDLIKFAQIDSDTEHQLDNFGPGSAWMIESSYNFRVDYTGEQGGDDCLVQVTIIKA